MLELCHHISSEDEDFVGEYGRCWVLGTKDQTPTSFCGSSELLRTPTDPTIPTNPTEFFR
jgi:hypothetical protein